MNNLTGEWDELIPNEPKLTKKLKNLNVSPKDCLELTNLEKLEEELNVKEYNKVKQVINEVKRKNLPKDDIFGQFVLCTCTSNCGNNVFCFCSQKDGFLCEEEHLKYHQRNKVECDECLLKENSFN